MLMRFYGGKHSLTMEEIKMVDMLLEQPEMRFFGRYSIELPADYKFKTGGLFINDADMTVVSSKKQFYPAFKQFLQHREEKLRATHAIDPANEPFLKNIYSLPHSQMGVIFEHTEEVYLPDSARILNAWKWIDNVVFSIKMKANDERAARYNRYRDITPKAFQYNVQEKKAQILTILSGLYPRKENKKPAVGRIAINFGEADEHVLGKYDSSVEYLNSKNISIELKTDNKINFEPSLLDTDRRVFEMEDGKTLYKGTRNINGNHCSEWLIQRKGKSFDDFYITYEFNFVANETRPNGSQPLWIRMTYDVDFTKRDEILTEYELVAFWQYITDTIKYYP